MVRAGRNLRAFLRDEDTTEAAAGSFLVAEFMLRVIQTLTSKK